MGCAPEGRIDMRVLKVVVIELMFTAISIGMLVAFAVS